MGCPILGKKISETVFRLGANAIQMSRSSFRWCADLAKQPLDSTGCYDFVDYDNQLQLYFKKIIGDYV